MAVLWLWLVLLQFNLINQTVLPEEDVENKPWRPIPAGRISLQNAISARWISILTCGLVSSYFGAPVFVQSVLFTCMASLYNFCDGDRNGFAKNLITGLGTYSLALGTTLVAGEKAFSLLRTEYEPNVYIHTACNTPSLSETLDCRKYPELSVFFCILVTTVHAQDFRDVEGDQLVGRQTIPMNFPQISRASMPVFLPAWSIAIAVLFNIPAWMAAAYVALSVVVGLRFVFMRDPKADSVSYDLYNVSLSPAIHCSKRS